MGIKNRWNYVRQGVLVRGPLQQLFDLFLNVMNVLQIVTLLLLYLALEFAQPRSEHLFDG